MTEEECERRWRGRIGLELEMRVESRRGVLAMKSQARGETKGVT